MAIGSSGSIFLGKGTVMRGEEKRVSVMIGKQMR